MEELRLGVIEEERDTVGEREREGDAVSEDCGSTTVNKERNNRSQKEGLALANIVETLSGKMYLERELRKGLKTQH